MSVTSDQGFATWTCAPPVYVEASPMSVIVVHIRAECTPYYCRVSKSNLVSKSEMKGVKAELLIRLDDALHSLTRYT
jgi:hypothetical protein